MVAELNFKVAQEPSEAFASDQLVIGHDDRVIAAIESLLLARPDAGFDLADGTMVHARGATRKSCVAEESTNSWPTLRSSQVLRDTIGERFLFDQKCSNFVNEFVPHNCCS